nr:MG2 domain-containing protein [Cecembia calidifontis]
MFLHTDKPYYIPSDTIWFKAYVTTPDKNFRESATPSVPLYVELIKPSVIPIASRKIIKLKDGRGAGDFVIPRELKPGIYKLRAYTSYSLNFGDQAFFEKEIFISDKGQAFHGKMELTVESKL